MRRTSAHAQHRRPWAAALIGSAAVTLAVAVVFWTVSDALVATITAVAVGHDRGTRGFNHLVPTVPPETHRPRQSALTDQSDSAP